MMFKKTTAQPSLTQPSLKQLAKDKNDQENKNPQQSAQSKPAEPLQQVAENDSKITQRPTQAPLDGSNKKLQVKKESVQQVPKPNEIPLQQSNQQFLSQYHYSETSIVSEKRRAHKEKKYCYIGQQPGLPEIQENISLFPGNRKPPLDEGENSNEIPNSEGKDTTRYGENDAEQNKPKIVVGSYQLQKALDGASSKDSQKRYENKINNQIENETRPKQSDPHLNSGQQYFSEEYNESSAKEHRSTQKRVISIRGGPTVRNQNLFPDTSNRNKYPGLKEQPAKELPTNNLKFSEDEQVPVSDSSSEEKNNGQKQPRINRNQDALEIGKTSSLTVKNGTNSSHPITKNDGDIVIYIRQPRKKERVLAPKITVDVTDSHSMTTSELEAQKIQVHEIQSKKGNGRKIINPRKSKSADIYQTTFNNGKFDFNILIVGHIKSNKFVIQIL